MLLACCQNRFPRSCLQNIFPDCASWICFICFQKLFLECVFSLRFLDLFQDVWVWLHAFQTAFSELVIRVRFPSLLSGLFGMCIKIVGSECWPTEELHQRDPNYAVVYFEITFRACVHKLSSASAFGHRIPNVLSVFVSRSCFRNAFVRGCFLDSSSEFLDWASEFQNCFQNSHSYFVFRICTQSRSVVH